MILVYQADQEEDVRTTTQCRSAKNNEGLHPPVVFVGAVVIGTHISYRRHFMSIHCMVYLFSFKICILKGSETRVFRSLIKTKPRYT